MTDRPSIMPDACSAAEIADRIRSLDRFHVENAISRYLVETKCMAQESFGLYLTGQNT
jgi:hypothetical protein